MPALYPQLLGEAWQALGPPVRRLHAGARGPHRGTFTVTRGKGRLARLLGWLMGLPEAGEAVPVTLELSIAADAEIWRRTFGARSLVTAQYRRSTALAERIGPIECQFRLDVRDGTLSFAQTGAALVVGPLCLALPRWSWPRVVGRARPAGERVAVEVSIAVPLAGLLVAYCGEIAVSEAG